MKTTEDKVTYYADVFMDLMDRATASLVKYGSLILLGVFLGYAWRMVQGF
jgi:hypothetical protein